MGFGKEREGLNAVSPYGANVSFQQRTAFFLKQQSEQKQRKGAGGNLYGDKFKPTMEVNQLDEGRLIKGAYEYIGCDRNKNTYKHLLEYWPYISHYDGREERSSICSGGIFHNFKDARDPCHGCDLFWSTRETGPDGKKKKGRVSKSDQYAFNWLHYHPYHKIPQVDRETGQAKMNAETNEPYYEWVQCDGRLCKICPQNVETVPARLLKWEMGIQHFTALTVEYQSQVGNTCKSCGTRDSISTIAYVCSNEACGEAVIDMRDTTLSDADIIKIKNEPATCTQCKKESWLTEIMQCSNCSTPDRSTIFDVDLKVRRMPMSDGSNGTQLIVSSWSAPHPIDPRYVVYAEKTFDMPRIYQPSDLEFQARQFRITGGAPAGGPVQRTPVNSGFRNYAAGQQQGGGGQQGPNYGS